MDAHLFRTGLITLILLVALSGTGLSYSVPDNINLNTKGKLYDSFSFNHAKHIQLTKECADCHHHATGTLMEDPNCIRCHRNSGETKTVACRGCHSADPFSAATMKEVANSLQKYHLDKPGVKAAMHQNCLGCHSKKNGPTGCQDCHRRTKEGDAFYNSGQFAPKGKSTSSGHGGH